MQSNNRSKMNRPCRLKLNIPRRDSTALRISARLREIADELEAELNLGLNDVSFFNNYYRITMFLSVTFIFSTNPCYEM
ncbi:unnamed protein product [Protopolystoma xenopodis]|uniref:Uncharacterized protein n=1 Tax=Protopolystoma xenopodis TaxID=117903 RepID=A0A3S4ZJW2_9PLAT|nr:unnamed protein product [Protopolystoma xenopodis]